MGFRNWLAFGVALLLMGSAAFAAHCACGTISAPNTVCTQTSSVSASGATCFNITAQNVTIDCAGYGITGDNTNDTYGIYSNQYNTTVKNCAINSFYQGIRFDGTNASTIRNSTVRAAEAGIYLAGAYNVVDKVDSNGSYGISARGYYCNFTDSSFSGSWGASMLSSSGATNSRIDNCNVSGNGSVGIRLAHGNSTIINSRVSCHPGSVDCSALHITSSSHDNMINNSNFSAAKGKGIFVEGSRTAIDRCMANGSVGLYIYRGYGTVATNTQGYNSGVSSVGSAGIKATSPLASNAVFINCTAISREGPGLVIGADWSRFVNGRVAGVGQSNHFWALQVGYWALPEGYFAGVNMTVANTTIDGYGSSYAVNVSSSGNVFINNTIFNATTLVYVMGEATGNLFYWNNFSSAGSPALYINDTAGGNLYNATVGGRGEGNVYANVISGAVSVTGAVVSAGYPGLVIGWGGTGYPYNAANSGGKVAGSAVDYAPLTPTSARTSPTLTSSSVTCGAGGACGGKTRLYYAWDAIPGATSYLLWIFNGYLYESHDIGNILSWDSDVANWWPSDAQIDSWAAGGRNGSIYCNGSSYCADGTGSDLANDPNYMYYKANSSYTGTHQYYWTHLSTKYPDGSNSGTPWAGATSAGGSVGDCTCIANGSSCVYSYSGYANDWLCGTGSICGANHSGAGICCSGGTCCLADTDCTAGSACERDYTPSTAAASPAVITCPSTEYPDMAEPHCVQQAYTYSCEPAYNIGRSNVIQAGGANGAASKQTGLGAPAGGFPNDYWGHNNSNGAGSKSIYTAYTTANTDLCFYYVYTPCALGGTIKYQDAAGARGMLGPANVAGQSAGCVDYPAWYNLSAYLGASNGNFTVTMNGSTGWYERDNYFGYARSPAGSGISVGGTSNSHCCLAATDCIYNAPASGNLGSGGYAKGTGSYNNVPYNGCYESGSRADVDGNGNNDYCGAGTWVDCAIDSDCANGYYCTGNSCVADVPVIVSVSLVPTAAYAGDTFRCNATVTDRQQSTLTVNYQWYKNGALQGAYSGSTSAANNTNTQVSQITPTITQGDTWYCRVNAYDGVSTSDWSNSNTASGNNHPPQIASVFAIPATALTSDTLSCVAKATDAENSSLAIRVEWYKNGVNQTALAASYSATNNTQATVATVAPGFLSAGDTWYCRVRAYDSTNYSGWNSSNSIPVQPGLSGSVGLYVNDTNGTNFYNATMAGQAEGNLWENVISGEVNVYGPSLSGYGRGSYVGIGGTNYPYNQANSLGRFACNFASCADYAPITWMSSLLCGSLNKANTTYTMTHDLASTGTCFNVTAPNVTINCRGKTITGSNATGSYGVYSSQPNTTVENCIILNYQRGVYFSGTVSGTVKNTTANTTHSAGNGIRVESGSGDLLANSSGNSRGGSGAGIAVWSSPGTRLSNATGTATYIACYLRNATGASVAGSLCNSTYVGGWLEAQSSGNAIANSTFIGGTYAINLYSDFANSTFTNNTLAGATATSLLQVSAQSGGNAFCWNNFTNTSGRYINDSGTGNLFNSSLCSGEGNIYAAVMNDSLEVAGLSASSGFAGLYAGIEGAAYPMSSATSGGRIAGNAIDYAPLTPHAVLRCGSLGVAGTTYNMTKDLNASSGCFTIGAANVTLNCRGRTITGNNSTGSIGVLASGVANATIRDCVVAQFDKGISLAGGTTASSALNDTLTLNTGAGIHLSASGTNTVANNTVLLAGGKGIYLASSSNGNLLSDNSIASTADGAGMQVEGSSANTLLRNNASSTSWIGIYLASATGNTITNCTASATTVNGTGMRLQASNGNMINGGLARSTSNAVGLSLISSSNNLVNGTNASSTGNNGTFVYGGSNNTFTEFKAYSEGATAFSAEGSAGLAIVNSTASTSSGVYGISLSDSPNSRVEDSNATAASGAAIYLASDYCNITNSRGQATTGFGLRLNGAGHALVSGSTLITSTGESAYLDGSSDYNTFHDNTLSALASGDLLHLGPQTSGNLFYWNVFGNTLGAYANDESATQNIYNTTTGGRGEGNQWYEVTNGLRDITGSYLSARYPSYYLGLSGSDYPYKASTSAGKIKGSAIDYAPMTPIKYAANYTPHVTNFTQVGCEAKDCAADANCSGGGAPYCDAGCNVLTGKCYPCVECGSAYCLAVGKPCGTAPVLPGCGDATCNEGVCTSSGEICPGSPSLECCPNAYCSSGVCVAKQNATQACTGSSVCPPSAPYCATPAAGGPKVCSACIGIGSADSCTANYQCCNSTGSAPGICNLMPGTENFSKCISCLPLGGVTCHLPSDCCAISGLNVTCKEGACVLNNPPAAPAAPVLKVADINATTVVICSGNCPPATSPVDPDRDTPVKVEYQWMVNDEPATSYWHNYVPFSCDSSNLSCGTGSRITLRARACDRYGSCSYYNTSGEIVLPTTTVGACYKTGEVCGASARCCAGWACRLAAAPNTGTCRILSGTTITCNTSDDCFSGYCALDSVKGVKLCVGALICNQTCTSSSTCPPACPICANGVCHSCIPVGSSTMCTASSQCCPYGPPGSLHPGLCNLVSGSCTYCLPINMTCSLDSDCCSGRCQTSTVGTTSTTYYTVKLCAPYAPACRQIGGSCHADANCCSSPAALFCDRLNYQTGVATSTLTTTGQVLASYGRCTDRYEPFSNCEYESANHLCVSGYNCSLSGKCLPSSPSGIEFAGWVKVGAVDVQAASPQNSHSGTTAMALKGPMDGSAYVYSSTLTDVLESDKKYLLDFWAKPSQSGMPAAKYALYDSFNNAYLSNSSGWLYANASGTPPDGCMLILPQNLTNYVHATRAFNTLEDGRITLRLYPISTDDFGYVDDVAITKANDFSIMLWVRADANQTGGPLVLQASGTGSAQRGINWSVGTNNMLYMNIRGSAGSISPQLSLADGRWHQVAMSVDRTGNYSVYLDGRLQSTAQFAIGAVNASAPLYIGGTNASGFRGEVGEVRFYKRAFTAADARDHYEGKYQQQCKIGLTVTYNSTQAQNLSLYYNADLRVRRLLPETILSMPFDLNVTSDSRGAITDYSRFLGHGTKTGADWSFSGRVGGAYEFGGGSDRIELLSPLINGTGDFTLSAWINPSSLSGTQCVMCTYNASNAGGFLFGMDGFSPAFGIGAPPPNVTDNTVSAGHGQWTHIAATRKGGTVTLYVNGAATSSATLADSIGGSAPLTIGGTPGGALYGFMGRIDEVRAYSRALTATEIASIYGDATTAQGGALPASK